MSKLYRLQTCSIFARYSSTLQQFRVHYCFYFKCVNIQGIFAHSPSHLVSGADLDVICESRMEDCLPLSLPLSASTAVIHPLPVALPSNSNPQESSSTAPTTTSASVSVPLPLLLSPTSFDNSQQSQSNTARFVNLFSFLSKKISIT